MLRQPVRPFLPLLGALLAAAPSARAQCPENGPIQTYVGAGTITCPCFVANEEALTIIVAGMIPAADYPIQITKIGIGWGSQSGGAPQTVEDSLVVYTSNPTGAATPAYQYFAPQMTDGFINEFDITATAPVATINAPPFAVGIRFFNTNDQTVVGPGAPSTIEDGNGCTPGRNKIKAVSGLPPGFYDFCALGGSGDWVIYVKYKRASCTGGGGVGTPYCFGDGTGAVLCPCDPGQSGGAGEGCANSFGTGGKISASGIASVSNDQVKLRVENLPPTTSALFFQGNAQQNGGNGAQFGDGLLCVTSSIIRLGTKVTAAGVAEYGFGVGTDPLVSVRGMLPGGGGVRHYQVWYRNSAAFCTAAAFNLSNGLTINWAP